MRLTRPERCRSKRWFPTMEEAERQATILEIMFVYVTPYKCNHCQGYHHTSRIGCIKELDVNRFIDREDEPYEEKIYKNIHKKGHLIHAKERSTPKKHRRVELPLA